MLKISFYAGMGEGEFGDLARVSVNGELVLTTNQLAEFYDCESRHISQNFIHNEDRFVEGKHYFKLEGEDLKQFKEKLFKNYSFESNIPKRDSAQSKLDKNEQAQSKLDKNEQAQSKLDKNEQAQSKLDKNEQAQSKFRQKEHAQKNLPYVGKFAPVLYLWTARGTARHAKILENNRAWEVFEKLEDNYFSDQKASEKIFSDVDDELTTKEKIKFLLQAAKITADSNVRENLISVATKFIIVE